MKDKETGSIEHRPRPEYVQAMTAGLEAYGDVLETLRAAGLRTQFTQTGGMCAALQIDLDVGGILLVTDEEDSLPWDRAEHQGWRVSRFDTETSVESSAETASSDGSIDALLRLIERIVPL